MEGNRANKDVVTESPEGKAGPQSGQQKAPSSHKPKPCPDSDGLGFWGSNGIHIG
jgi:hypothetical protein